jgi:hypothetical protein
MPRRKEGVEQDQRVPFAGLEIDQLQTLSASESVQSQVRHAVVIEGF